jgi:hypothetical protein
MKDKHTPGPWRVSKNDSIYAKDEFIGIALSGKPWGRELPQEANARLMAAAPELLEFVEGVAEGLNTGSNPGHLEDAVEFLEERAQRIIAKIEGDEAGND